MNVQVKLHALLRKFAPKKNGHQFTVEVDDAASIQDVLDHIGVPAEKARLIIVNGIRKQPSDTLADGDVLDLFPPLAGG